LQREVQDIEVLRLVVSAQRGGDSNDGASWRSSRGFSRREEKEAGDGDDGAREKKGREARVCGRVGGRI
jgi:hypothetical protein